jgi:hypothetical protein
MQRKGPRQFARAFFAVIASEAKQSIAPQKERMDCFVASAPRNDGKIARAAALLHGADGMHR